MAGLWRDILILANNKRVAWNEVESGYTEKHFKILNQPKRTARKIKSGGIGTMKRAVYASLICLFVIVFFATVSMAQVEEMAIGNTFGVGARTMGMGGASLGLADDFTALYWNPAGMAQIQKFEFLVVFT